MHQRGSEKLEQGKELQGGYSLAQRHALGVYATTAFETGLSQHRGFVFVCLARRCKTKSAHVKYSFEARAGALSAFRPRRHKLPGKSCPEFAGRAEHEHIVL